MNFDKEDGELDDPDSNRLKMLGRVDENGLLANLLVGSLIASLLIAPLLMMSRRSMDVLK